MAAESGAGHAQSLMCRVRPVATTPVVGSLGSPTSMLQLYTGATQSSGLAHSGGAVGHGRGRHRVQDACEERAEQR